MSDVNKVRSNTGVQYGFEDIVARQRAEEAITIANEAKDEAAQTVEIYVQGTSLVINTELVNGNEVSF